MMEIMLQVAAAIIVVAGDRSGHYQAKRQLHQVPFKSGFGRTSSAQKPLLAGQLGLQGSWSLQYIAVAILFLHWKTRYVRAYCQMLKPLRLRSAEDVLSRVWHAGVCIAGRPRTLRSLIVILANQNLQKIHPNAKFWAWTSYVNTILKVPPSSAFLGALATYDICETNTLVRSFKLHQATKEQTWEENGTACWAWRAFANFTSNDN